MIGKLPSAELTHVGFYVRDLDAMIAFYSRVMGLVLTDSGDYYRGGRIAFLSRNADEHHQVVLASGRPEGPTTINQISFRVADLEALRQSYAVLVAERVDELVTRNHGNAWSVYFHDPEGNRIEIYTPSPWYVAQPFGRPLDLTEPAAVILAATETLVRNDPTHRPIEAWAADMKARLGERA